MNKTQLTKSLSIIIIAIVVTSCASNGHFTSRKYIVGNYKSNKHKAHKTIINETIINEPVNASTDNDLTESDFKKDRNLFSPTENYETKTATKNEKSKLTFVCPLKKIKNQIKEYKKAKEFKKNNIENKQPENSASSKGVDTKALISLILSVLALVLEFMGLILLNEFGFFIIVLFFALGLALGITSLIMGIKGLKNHRENKGSIHDLIFSIIGISISGIVILVSMYFLIGPLSEIILWL